MSKEGKIIIVDDRADWQETMSMTIEELGHQAITFSDVESTKQFIKDHSFALAVIDQRLDETDERNKSGLDLARTIRESNREVPIIIITGYGSLETIEEAYKKDENGYRLATQYILKDDQAIDKLTEAIEKALP